jgi:hypothetical protein
MALKPLHVMRWYDDPNPPTQWHLATSADLVRYFDSCLYNAGAFGFISAVIFQRDRFLANRDRFIHAVTSGYIHLWGMLEFLRQPLHLHYIPEVLIQNRMSDLHADARATTDLFGRWWQDLEMWAAIADNVFGGLRDVHGAFSRVLGRNHGGDTFLPRLRASAPTQEDWQRAVPYLVRAGFEPALIAAVDYGYRHRNVDRLPIPTQDPATQGFAILPFLAQGARHIAVLALGGLPNLVSGAALLSALTHLRGMEPIRIYVTEDGHEVLEGFEVQRVDLPRFLGDEAYRSALGQTLVAFAPELVINLDPGRRLEADDLLASAYPNGAIAYDLPERAQDPALRKALNGGYTCLIPPSGPPEAMLEALGLEAVSPRLWPEPAAQEEAQAILEKLGWDPDRIRVVLVDAPSLLEDPSLKAALATSMEGEGYLIGIGGRGVPYPRVEALLGLWKGRTANLTGVLGLGSTVALLQLCGGFLGGTPRYQALARVCGSATLPPKPAL